MRKAAIAGSGALAIAFVGAGPADALAGSSVMRGKAFGAEARLVAPDKPTVRLGKLAAQGLPCVPVSGRLYTNEVLRSRIAAPLGSGLPNPVLVTGKVLNEGRAIFGAGPSDVLERSTVEDEELLGGRIQGESITAQSVTRLTSAGVVQEGRVWADRLEVDGERHSGEIGANTKQTINGLGEVTLNKQEVDGAGNFVVTAIHVLVDMPGDYVGEIRIGVASTKQSPAAARVLANAYALTGRSGSGPASNALDIGRQNGLSLGCGGSDGLPRTRELMAFRREAAPGGGPVLGLSRMRSSVAGQRLNGASWASALAETEQGSLADQVEEPAFAVEGRSILASSETREQGGKVVAFGTSTVGDLRVGEETFEGEIAPNTPVPLGDFGEATLNRQRCSSDGGPERPLGADEMCEGDEQAQLTVTAVHVHITSPDNPFGVPSGSVLRMSNATSGLHSG